MTALLEMPSTYTEIHEDEFDAIEGGVIPVAIAVVGGVLSGIGATYKGGVIAGERCYHAGLRNREYQSIKWQIRTLAIGQGGPLGGIFMLGFENKFYSMVS